MLSNLKNFVCLPHIGMRHEAKFACQISKMFRGNQDEIEILIQNILINLYKDILTESIVNQSSRSLWTREWIAERPVSGASVQLFAKINSTDRQEFRVIFRMSTEQFQFLLNLLMPKIQRNDTFYRQAIPAKDKLQTTLYYLTTGCSFKTLQQIFRLGRSTIELFIPEVCAAIFDAVKEYIQVRIILFSLTSSLVQFLVIHSMYNSISIHFE